MNILIPIAGVGARFKSGQRTVPKPLVSVNGKTLLEYAISTLGLEGNYIFVTLKYEIEEFNDEIDNIIKKLCNNPQIIRLDKPTRGAAETCLAAESLIDNEKPLVITNGDQYLNWDSSTFMDFINTTNPDACVTLYDHGDIVVGEKSKYSFVKLNSQGYAVSFAEKLAISPNALNGVHYWKNGKEFVETAKDVINDNIRVNNEFYVSNTFNYMIKKGKLINTYKMANDEYYSLGSPTEINNNLKYIK